MEHFDILSPTTPVYRSVLLEASAGTGKTFTIEHLFVRLLLECDPGTGQPCQISQILAVTFTRAATRELKMRIRANIQKALDHSILEVDKRRLEAALACFDEAQIFTLHGFCAHSLRGYIDHLATSFGEESPRAFILETIKDFFRTQLDASLVSPIQLKRLLADFRGDINSLQEALFKDLSKGLPIVSMPTFEEHLKIFQATMQLLLKEKWQAEAIIDDFKSQLSSFKKLGNAQPASLLPAVERMARLFDQTQWTAEDFEQLLRDDLVLAKLELLKRKSSIDTPVLHYPNLRPLLGEKLLPIITKAMTPSHIYATIAHHCLQLLERHMDEKETGGPDQLLKQMDIALENPHFLQNAQQLYRFVIVDEFQDTDPLQWRILTKMFLQAPDPRPYLTLVGDPKQSIYSFRQADVYTYLHAAQQFPPTHRLGLKVNYRSQKHLVEAINCLFNEDHCPGLISLPRHRQSLAYPLVQASPNSPHKNFSDTRAALHFFLTKAQKGRLRSWPGEELEKRSFLPYIASEILKLHQQEGLEFKQIAVLVRDRHQAAATRAVLQQFNLPVLSQRQSSLVESPARQALVEWLAAMIDPQDQGALRCALGGSLGAWSAQQLADLDGEDEMNSHQDHNLSQIQHLRQLLIEQGIAAHVEALLKSCWQLGGPSVLERLLSTPAGIELYRDLQQITSILSEHQAETHCGIQGLLMFLDQFSQRALHNEEPFKILQDGNQDAVRILTTHMSKGLEFDVVFALGLVKRTGADERLMCDPTGSTLKLRVIESDEAAFRLVCLEQDAEKVRQAYVAMTRAKHRLYIPVAIAEEGSKIDQGEAAPIELLLGRLGQPLCDEAELYDRINTYDGSALLNFIQTHPGISHEWITEPTTAASLRRLRPPTLIPPLDVCIPQRPCQAYSFTSLVEKKPGDERFQENQSTDKTVHTLPAGRDTGIIIHQILQSIAFDQPLSLSPFLKGTLLEEWEPVVNQLLYHTLNTPLPLRGSPKPFALSQTDPAKQYRELEFVYPAPSPGTLNTAQVGNGFLRGSIDLLISHANHYYLIDWKTNWLGPDAQAYHPEALAQAILQHGYQLQAQIYSQALKRYLKLVDPRPFEECFGGMYFLFLRGLNANSSESRGCYVFS